MTMRRRVPTQPPEAGAGGLAPVRREPPPVPWPIELAASVLCKRWKPGLLWLIAHGTHRFGELAAALPGITPKTLTRQLRELEDDQLVVRHAVVGGPRHVEYRLSPVGEALQPTVDALERWGRFYEQACPDALARSGLAGLARADLARAPSVGRPALLADRPPSVDQSSPGGAVAGADGISRPAAVHDPRQVRDQRGTRDYARDFSRPTRRDERAG